MSFSTRLLMMATVLGGSVGIESVVVAAPLPAAADQASSDDTTEQNDGDVVLGQIIVTARKRSETAQSVPATIQAFDSDRLAQSGIINTRDLQKAAPSLSVAPAFRETFVALRGITNNVRSLGADPSVAVNFNGVYLPRTTMLLTELYDIERVEVLKGPQGDLYGRNATGGAINILSKAPESGIGAEGFAGVGSFDLRRVQGALNAGNDVIALRVSGAIAKDDGYTRNVFNDTRLDSLDFESLRAQLRLTPGNGVDVTAFWHTSSDETSIGYAISADPAFGLDASQFGFVGLAGPQNLRVSPRVIRTNESLDLGRKGDIAGLTASADFGGVSLKSITGYTRSRIHDKYDTDGTSASIEYTRTQQRYRSVSEELQLISEGERLDWVIGGYLYRDEGVDRYDNPFNDNVGTSNPPSYSSAPNYARLEGKSTAAYGHGTFHVVPSLDLIVGGRYTRDEKTGYSTIGAQVNVDETVRFDKFTPSGELVWRINPDVMLYGSVSQGFKSGGLNFLDNSGFPAFRPENITAYELGLKSTPFDSSSILNVSAFYYDYEDIQFRTSFFLDPNDPKVAVTNASSAEVWGGEIQWQDRIVGPLAADASVAYLSTSVSGYTSPTNGEVLNGRVLPMSPEWSGNVGLLVDMPIAAFGQLRLRCEYAFRTEILFPYTYDAAAGTITDGYSGVLNATARFTLPGEKTYFELIGRNLSNDLYRTFRANFPPFVAFDAFGPPRTIEARIGVKF